MPTYSKSETRYIIRSLDECVVRCTPAQHIVQGYLTSGPLYEVRTRLTTFENGRPEVAEITRLDGLGADRVVTTETISPEAARLLLRDLPVQISKARHIIGDWKVDFLKPPLGNLVLAERRMYGARVMEMPPWIHDCEEVTDRLSNHHLARLAVELEAVGQDRPLLDYLKPVDLKSLALTGSPCSGKTTLINEIRRLMGDRLHYVPETATVLISNVGLRPPPPGHDLERRRFQQLMYQSQCGFEGVSIQQALLERRLGIAMDRGTVDNAAYLPGGIPEFEATFRTTIAREFARYGIVICLAPPSREVYEAFRANNPARSETYEEVVALAARMCQVWGQHPNFHYVDGDSMEEKSTRALEIVTRFFN